MNAELRAISARSSGLITLLKDVLAHICATYNAENVPLPGRRYYTVGTPVVECDQLVVSFSQLYLGMPGDEGTTPQQCHMPQTAVLAASVSRCFNVDGRGAASVESLEDAADWSLVDAFVLMEAGRGADMWDPSGRGIGTIATIAPAEPQGGMMITTLNLTLAVP